MTSGSVGLARGILRNAGGLFLVGVFAKGMGLIIAVLVARFLGPDAMGLFALLFSVAMLLETFISIGLSDSLVRDVASNPGQARNLYFHALKLVLAISVIPALALAVAAFLGDGQGSMRASLLVVAFGAPVSGAFVVSQAVMQGTERVLMLTWVTFLARLLSLVWLLIALLRGAGVEAAFVSRVLFQAASVIVFFMTLRRGAAGEPAGFTIRDMLTRSLPFALNQAVREVGVRLPSLMLPGTIGLARSGVFDTANRVRSTLGMTMSAAIVGMMPSFARNFAEPGGDSGRLVGFSIKYMCLAMSAVATAICLCADWLIGLLFGPAFASASLPLQVLVWAQVLVAVDAVLQQVLLAAGREYAAVGHSAVGVVGQAILILLLATSLDLPGVALAVLLSAALTLALDLRIVVKHVVAIPVGRFAARPIATACLLAGVMLVTLELSFPVRTLVLAGSWGLALVLFQLLPREELRFMRQLAPWPRAKRLRNS